MRCDAMKENKVIDPVNVGMVDHRTFWHKQVPAIAFYGISTLLFTVCSVITFIRVTGMQHMDEMRMPGGWTMSMTWMIMPGQNCVSAVLSFICMWVMMMVPMMMPSLLLMLSRYDQETGKARTRFTWAAMVVGLGYFFEWILIGIIIFCLGMTLAAIAMKSTAFSSSVPIITAGIIAAAGIYQFTPWKARQLNCCKHAIQQLGGMPDNPVKAFKNGLQLGFYCNQCCLNLTIILLVTGTMDLKVMGLITVAMTAERLYANNKRIVYGIGVVALIAGLLLFIKSAGIN